MNNELDVMSRLVDYHDHISAPSVPVADDLRRGRRRVRRNRGLLAGGVALGLASVVAAVSLFTGERAADRPQPVDLPRETAVDTPGLTTTFVSPTYGYSFGYLDRGDSRRPRSSGIPATSSSTTSSSTTDSMPWRPA